MTDGADTLAALLRRAMEEGVTHETRTQALVTLAESALRRALPVVAPEAVQRFSEEFKKLLDGP